MSRIVSIFDSKILHILESFFVLFSLFVTYSYSLTFVFLLNYDKKSTFAGTKNKYVCTFDLSAIYTCYVKK